MVGGCLDRMNGWTTGLVEPMDPPTVNAGPGQNTSGHTTKIIKNFCKWPQPPNINSFLRPSFICCFLHSYNLSIHTQFNLLKISFKFFKTTLYENRRKIGLIERNAKCRHKKIYL
jgi:hypothetical protein